MANPVDLCRPWLAHMPWDSVVAANQIACLKGKAQHGFTSDGYEKTRSAWETEHAKLLELREAVELCYRAHRLAPFLFFNGNTFAGIAKDMCRDLTAKLDRLTEKIFLSAVGHYVAGTIGKEELEKVLAETAKRLAG